MFQFYQVIIVCLFLLNGSLAAESRYQFEMKSKSGLSQHSPVWINLPEGLRGAPGVQLKADESTELIACQISEDGQRAVFVLPEAIAADQSRTYLLVASAKVQDKQVEVIQQDSELSFRLMDSEVLAYQTKIAEPPEGFSELYCRSGHIHPFVTPQGKVVTDGFPIDHMHQHAIFAAWTKTSFEGERVDFWNQKAGTGTVLHKEVLKTTSGPVYASAQVRLVHTVLKETPQPVLDELWTVRLYNTPEIHLFDIESVQTCIAETPLTIDEYHYGGFAFRGSAEWDSKESHEIITNATKDRKVGNHTRPNWVGIFGEVQGDVCGAAMFSHPSNFRSPQPVRLHPSMPYFVYSPCVLGEFELKPGVPYQTKNRYIAFDGPPNEKLLNELWSDYSETPEIIWKEVQ